MASFGYFDGLFGAKGMTSMNELYSNLGNYSTIQKGSYKKLLTAYYADNKAGEQSTTTEAKQKTKQKTDTSVAKEYATVKKNADELVKASQNLLGNKNADVFEQDQKDSLIGKVRQFVNSYNETYVAASTSTNSKVKGLASTMSNNTKAYETELKSIGISISEDAKLNIDAEQLKSADVSKTRRLLSANSSFVGTTSKVASQLSVASLNAAGGTTTYGSAGKFSTMDPSSIYDFFT